MPAPYHFDEAYREDAVLADGTPVRLRLVRPDDRERLRLGFETLSPASRYLRFMGTKAGLSDSELDELTVLDGDRRLAIGAVGVGEAGSPGGVEDGVDGLGVARFARLDADPDVAEAAVAVVDSAQGRGLGSLLLRRLAAAAVERGVRRFVGEMLACNEGMRRLLADHAAATVVPVDGGVLRVTVELPPLAALMAGSPGPGDLLERVLAQAASGGLTMRIGELILKRR